MNRKILFSLFGGTAISVATLYLAFRNVPLPDLVIYMGSINYLWILPAVALIFISFGLRALRWQFILGAAYRVGFWSVFHPMMIGFMINCVLPGRVGEFARPIVLNRKTDIPISTGLATVVVERLFDLIMLLSLFMAVSAGTIIDPEIGIDFGNYRLNRETLEAVFNGLLKISAVLFVCIFLVSLEKPRKILHSVVLKLPNALFLMGESGKTRIRQNICRPIIQMIDNIASGMAMVKKPKKIGICLFLSIGIWATASLSYYAFSLGCPQIRLTPAEITTVMVIICFAIALPSVPGFWGLWEAAGVFAMVLFGVAEKDAAGFTLANHAVQMFPVILVGLLSAWLSGVNIFQVSYQNKR